MTRRLKRVYSTFYRIPRMGALELSGGGGPFGFDIAAAVQIDFLVKIYRCDVLVETGCHRGDTTDYLSLTYPKLSIIACDINQQYVQFTRHRLAKRSNVKIHHADSAVFLKGLPVDARFPFFYLDAHWRNTWPLARELESIRAGVVCIDDFDIGESRFAFDTYDGLDCNIDRLPPSMRKDCFKGKSSYDVGLPCLQTGRRAGKCYCVIGRSSSRILNSQMFEKLEK